MTSASGQNLQGRDAGDEADSHDRLGGLGAGGLRNGGATAPRAAERAGLHSAQRRRTRGLPRFRLRLVDGPGGRRHSRGARVSGLRRALHLPGCRARAGDCLEPGSHARALSFDDGGGDAGRRRARPHPARARQRVRPLRQARELRRVRPLQLHGPTKRRLVRDHGGDARRRGHPHGGDAAGGGAWRYGEGASALNEQALRDPTMAAFVDILYGAEGPIGVITLNRPQYRNAQSYRMLDEIDAAFELARGDEDVRVVLVRGAGGVFSTGHDLGTPDGIEYRRNLGAKPGVQTYDQFKKYNLDLLLKWRNFPKPTVAMVEGYCIYAGWMLAAAMDVVFAADTAEFLGGFVEYNTIPWDIGIRRAKELVFESRFINAAEAASFGLVNRVLPAADLERETLAWARRVA